MDLCIIAKIRSENAVIKKGAAIQNLTVQPFTIIQEIFSTSNSRINVPVRITAPKHNVPSFKRFSTKLAASFACNFSPNSNQTTNVATTIESSVQNRAPRNALNNCIFFVSSFSQVNYYTPFSNPF